MSLLTLQNPFFKVIGDSLTAQAAKSGYEAVVLSADQDVGRQSNQVKDFIVKKVAAIVPYRLLEESRPRVLGLLQGRARFKLREDFALSDEEFLSA